MRILTDYLVHRSPEDQAKVLSLFMDLEFERNHFDSLRAYPKIHTKVVWPRYERAQRDAILTRIDVADARRPYLTIGSAKPAAGDGAGRIRYNGHGANWCDFDTVEGEIRKLATDALQLPQLRQAKRFDIYVIGYLGGGTGSGAMPGIILLLRDAFEQQGMEVRVTVHGGLPDRRRAPTDKLLVRSDANAMALMAECMGMQLVATGALPSDTTFYFGERGIRIPERFVEEIFIVNDARMEPDDANTVIAADIALRMENGHGVAAAEAAEMENILEHIELDQQTALFPFMAASMGVEVIVPGDELAEKFAQQRLAAMLHQALEQHRTNRDKGRAAAEVEVITQTDFDITFDFISVNAAEWEQPFQSYMAQLHAMANLKRTTISQDLRTRIMGVAHQPQDFPKSLADLFATVSTRARSYQALASKYEAEYLRISAANKDPLPTQEAIAEAFRRIDNQGRNNQEVNSRRKRGYLEDQAESCRNWGFNVVVAEMYEALHQEWKRVQDALEAIYQRFETTVGVLTNRARGIQHARGELAHQAPFRRSIFDHQFFEGIDPRTLVRQIEGALHALEHEATVDVNLPDGWFVSLVETFRSDDRNTASQMEFATQRLLEGDASEPGWATQIAATLQQKSYLDVLQLTCQHARNIPLAQVLEKQIAWMVSQADDLVQLIHIPSATGINRIHTYGRLDCAWDTDQQRNSIKAITSRYRIQGGGGKGSDIEVTTEPSRNPHRLVLLYSVHGVDLTDIPMFAPTARYCQAMIQIDDQWVQNNRGTAIHAVFSCDFLRATVMGKDGVYPRLCAASKGTMP
jgi:hypothetical protein